MQVEFSWEIRLVTSLMNRDTKYLSKILAYETLACLISNALWPNGFIPGQIFGLIFESHFMKPEKKIT